jgi:hypothetical protein
VKFLRWRLTADPTDAPSLLNRAGFTTTTVDVEDLTISYPSIWELMQDLRDMGESNAILGRRGWVSRDVLLAAEGIYKGEYEWAIASRQKGEKSRRLLRVRGKTGKAKGGAQWRGDAEAFSAETTGLKSKI